VRVTQMLPGLQMESALSVPSALNFRPPSWPPPDDFPVCIDAKGNVTARFGDRAWDISPWAGKAFSVAFEGASPRVSSLSSANARLLRLLAAWWLWGPDAARTAGTLKARVVVIKPLFAACSVAGVEADTLSRFPRVIEAVAKTLRRSNADAALASLSRLRAAREQLGFELLDKQGLQALAKLLPKHAPVQTAYIPQRIWTYQVLRLKQCLDDYLAHREKVEACYRFCLAEYAHNGGGALAKAFGMPKRWAPFLSPSYGGRSTAGTSTRRYHGAFRKTAERFGIADLIERWFGEIRSVQAISGYLGMISKVAVTYCLNFSLMRQDEGAQLRTECLRVEHDEVGDRIYLVGGVTTKTIHDNEAWWIVAPSVGVAIDAARHVAFLRLDAARHAPDFLLSAEDVRNPLLLAKSSEPWARRTHSPRVQLRGYGKLLEEYPNLLDAQAVRITPEDYEIAHKMTAGLDVEAYAVGRPWPFAHHQLRRTGAVNMLASGLVGEPSLQYQLKHLVPQMTRYYGQHSFKLKSRLDDDAAGMFIREMHVSIGRELLALRDNRDMVSPVGEKRRAQLLNCLSGSDLRQAEKLAKSGKLAFRRTLFGGCLNPVPCPYGGISHFAPCMGTGSAKPCKQALIDKGASVQEDVRKLIRSIKVQLLDAQAGSPLQDSLQASLEATERYFHVVNDCA
jgi:hypothetical protein